MEITGTISGTKVDVNADRAMFVEIRPPAIDGYGVYNVALQSGTIAASMTANSNVWSFRWSDPIRFALIKKVTVNCIELSAVTAAQFDLSIYFARSFSSPDTNANSSTTATLTGDNGQLRTSFSSSLVAAGDIRMLGTAGFNAGQRTLDTNPLSRVVGWAPNTAGAFVFNSPMPISIVDRTGAGQYPIVLANNEGLVIQNPIVGPAVGTLSITVNVDWQEVLSY